MNSELANCIVGQKTEAERQPVRARNSKMKIMSVSHKRNIGSAAHFACALFRNPTTMGIHSGSVWISWRGDPGGTLTAPTTYSAIRVASAATATIFEFIGHNVRRS